MVQETNQQSKQWTTVSVRRELFDDIESVRINEHLSSRSAALHKVIVTGLIALKSYSGITSKAS